MTGASALERRYRRLLAFYPAQYRRVHEEEMLAVLMTGAPEGKRRPGIAECADLLLGALRVRLRPPRDGAAEPGWRDALAVLSVILPVIILLMSAVQETRLLLSFPGSFSYGFPLWVLPALIPPFAMAALVLLRLRRVAALAAGALLIWLVSLTLTGLGLAAATGGAYLFLALGLEIVALIASPGPRRGLQILTWKPGALIVIATLAVGTGTIPMTPAVRLSVIAVVCAGMALASSLSRWLLVLLAIPACPFFLGDPISAPGFRMALTYLPPPLALIVLAYLPPLVLLALAVVAARRESLRSS